MARGEVSAGTRTKAESVRVEVAHDVEAEMRDGTILRADVYRPFGAGKCPVLVCRTPYGKRGEAFGPGYEDYERTALGLAGRGYLVVVQDVRGRYASEGEYRWLYEREASEIHARDGYDTTEWAAGLTGSDGRVGTFGNSYDGYTALRTVGAAPPSLTAALASGIAARMQDESSGIFEPIYLEWANAMAVDLRVRSGDAGGPLTREAAEAEWALARGKWLWNLPFDALPDDLFGVATDWLRKVLREQVEDPWALPDTHGDVDVPVCHITGWWDFVARGTIANFNGLASQGRSDLSDRHRLVVGPWSHEPGSMASGAGAVSYGPDESASYHDLVADWYDFAFEDEDAVGFGEAPVRAFVLNENRWQGLGSWPPAATQPLELFLHGDGRLAASEPTSEAPRMFTYDPRNPMPSTSDWSTRAVDQSVLAHRRDVLRYVSDELDGELRLVGDVECVLWVASDAVETDFTVKLVEVRPDGRAIALSTGIVRTRYLNGYDRIVSLEPNRRYELTIPMGPVGILFRPGSRLRLDVSSSDFPNFDRNHNTGKDYWSDPELRTARQTVFSDAESPSRLVIPVLATTTAENPGERRTHVG